jgi:uncharacterized protein (TIGR01244 family)
MKIVNLTDAIAVSEQVLPSDMQAVADAGFRVLVNNRPDGEAPGQPTSAELEEAASRAGIRYVYYPVNGMNYPGPDIASLGAVLDGDGPVLAFCRTGTRSANLWVSSRPEDARDEARSRVASLGYDLSLAR